MRIEIIGDNLASRTLTGYIHKLGYAVVKSLPTFTIYLEEAGDDFIIDGIDSDLERRILFHMEDLGAERFILQRKGSIRSDREIRVSYPAGKDEVVARGIARAIQEAKPKSIFNKKLFGILVLGILSAGKLEAQQFIYGRAWDSVNLAAVDSGDSVNRAIRVNCVTGCGGAGTLSVRPDGTIWSLTGTSANVNVTNTVPVSGTFWQATQPVSIAATISSNLAQVAGNTTATDIGDRSNATLRVVSSGIPNIVTGQVSCATTATLIANARAGRQAISVTNLGTTDTYVGTSGVTTANGDLIPGTKGAYASYPTSGALYCIVGAGTQSVTYAEIY